jgi:adenylate cyclase
MTLPSLTPDTLKQRNAVGFEWCANPMVAWLLRDGWSITDAEELTVGLADLLADLGLPVSRLTVVVRYLHPQVLGTSYIWRKGVEGIETYSPPHAVARSAQFLSSPFAPILSGEVAGIRRRLDLPDVALDFPILRELREDGMTDYVAMPLSFSDGSTSAVTLAGDRPGGFTTDELSMFYDALPVFARLVEIHANRHMARTLLDTYLGHHAGERVLKGLIKRGDVETIHSVICFADLRGSTRLAESLDRDAFLSVLNAYFECTAGAVLDNGGTVLRYIGDAVLAIFPIDPDPGASDAFNDAGSACRAALAAAREALQRVERHNGEHADDGTPPIRFGLALHIGDVVYGNIGVPRRLDFTVIGPAANAAARLESMCKPLDRSVLVSAAVAARIDEPLVSLGFHAFRGMREPQEVFTLPELGERGGTDAV